MAPFFLLFGIVTFCLWIFCLFDAIFTDEYRCRNLPKALWILVVIFLPTLGSIAWLVAGRPNDGVSRRRPWSSGSHPASGSASHRAYGNTGGTASSGSALTPEEQEAEFQRRFRARVEEQNRRARERRAEERDA